MSQSYHRTPWHATCGQLSNGTGILNRHCCCFCWMEISGTGLIDGGKKCKNAFTIPWHNRRNQLTTEIVGIHVFCFGCSNCASQHFEWSQRQLSRFIYPEVKNKTKLRNKRKTDVMMKLHGVQLGYQIFSVPCLVHIDHMLDYQGCFHRQFLKYMYKIKQCIASKRQNNQ